VITNPAAKRSPQEMTAFMMETRTIMFKLILRIIDNRSGKILIKRKGENRITKK
jgi:hypothetical protein